MEQSQFSHEMLPFEYKQKNNSANHIYGQTTPVTPLVKQLKPTRQELFHIAKWKMKYHQ